MKTVIKVLALVVILSMFTVPVKAAGPVSYESTINLTNTTGTSGSINFTYYNPDGTVAGTFSDSILAFETKWYLTLPGITTSFTGSAVISSSVKLASTSTLIGKNAASVKLGYGSYTAFSTGSTTVYIPLLMDSNYGFNTQFAVQNLSTTDVNVSVTYSDGLVVPAITGLKPGASTIINNQTEAHTAKKFSAVLVATGGEIAVTVSEWGDGSYGDPVLAYNGYIGGLTNPVFPMVNQNNYGYWTAIPIQNLGNEATSVTLTYTPTKAGVACTETITIPSHGQVEFGSYAFVFPYSTPPYTGMSSTCARGNKFVGNAIVTGNSTNQLLVGLINQTTTILPGTDKAASLMVLDQSDATNITVFPEVRKWYGPENWWSSITITNMGGSTLPVNDISCRAIGSDPSGAVDSTFQNPSALAPNEGWIIDLWNNMGPLNNGFIGGVICTSATGDIMGSSNTLGAGLPADIDSYAIYEGINE